MSESETREKIGEIVLTGHRQLSDVDREIKRACRTIDMNNNSIRAMITSCRELSTNALSHAGGGVVSWYLVRRADNTGIEVLVDDKGPGIVDVDQAMVDGYSSKGGLGLGLGGVSRMMDCMHIDSSPDAGTKVKAIKWR